MLVTKVLEKKGVIRVFGIGLILAPFFNVIVTILMQDPKVATLTWDHISQVIMSVSIANKILNLCSIVVGILMLTRAKRAWTYALVLIGGYVLMQIFNFGHEVRKNWVSGLFFIINAGIFLFIADQLVWKQKKISPIKAQPENKSKENLPTKKHLKKILIQFEGIGTWAQLLEVSDKGFLVKCLKLPPFDLAERDIEVGFKDGSVLRTRLSRRSDPHFFFEYVHLSEKEIHSLNKWMIELGKPA